MIHEIGNMTLRIFIPTTYKIGMTTIASSANFQLMKSMKPKAMMPMKHCTTISGANVEYICTLRISLLARLMS